MHCQHFGRARLSWVEALATLPSATTPMPKLCRRCHAAYRNEIPHERCRRAGCECSDCDLCTCVRDAERLFLDQLFGYLDEDGVLLAEIGMCVVHPEFGPNKAHVDEMLNRVHEWRRDETPTDASPS